MRENCAGCEVESKSVEDGETARTKEQSEWNEEREGDREDNFPDSCPGSHEGNLAVDRPIEAGMDKRMRRSVSRVRSVDDCIIVPHQANALTLGTPSDPIR